MSYINRFQAALLQSSTAWTLAGIPDVIRDWNMATGYTFGTGEHLSAIAPLWPTTVPLVQATSARQPLRLPRLGPRYEDLVSTTLATPLWWDFDPTGIMFQCTVLVSFCMKYVAGTNHGLFGRSATNNSYVKVSESTGKLEIRTVGGGDVEITLPRPLSRVDLNGLVLTYNASIGNGRVQVFLDKILVATTDNVGTGGLDFGRLGSTNGTSNASDCIWRAAAIVTRVLAGDELTRAINYLAAMRGGRVYFDATTGSDASATPWNPTTPLQDFKLLAASNMLRDGDILALKRGSITRTKLVIELGPNSGYKIIVDGHSYGDQNDPVAEVRPSVAPVLTPVSGDVYSCGPQYEAERAIVAITLGNPTIVEFDRPLAAPETGFIKFSNIDGPTALNGQTLPYVTDEDDAFFVEVDFDSTGLSAYDDTDPGIGEVVAQPFLGTRGGAPTDHIYHLPGGVLSFSGPVTGYEVFNGTRLRKIAWDGGTYPAALPAGRWTKNPTTHVMYFNAGVGVVLATGDIEIPIYVGEGSAAVKVRAGRKVVVDHLTIACPDGVAFQVIGGVGVVTIAMVTLLATLDGQDTAEAAPADGTSLLAIRPVAAWCGSGLTVPGAGGAGNGFSCHEGSAATFVDPIGAMNDKADHEHAVGSNVTIERGLSYSKCPYSWSTTAGQSAGVFRLRNSKGIVPAGFEDYEPLGIRHKALADIGDPALMEIDGCTFLSSDPTALGIVQDAATYGIRVRNTIIKGFAKALDPATGGEAAIDVDGLLLHGNAANYNGVTPGANDVLADPGFVNAPADLRIVAASPAKAAGVDLGPDRDFLAAMRSSTPSIGAHEALAA